MICNRMVFPLLGMLLLLGCGQPPLDIPRPDRERLVTEYGNQTLTVQDILIAFQENHTFNEFAPGAPVSAEEIISSITQNLIFDRERAAKAKAEGLDQTQRFQKYREDVVREELYQKLILEEILKPISIEESDIRSYYEEIKTSLLKKSGSNLYIVRGIRIELDETNHSTAEKQAQKAYALLQKGHAFESVAARFSDAPLNKRGKKMGIAPGLADPEVEQRIANLEDGEYCEPFKQKDKILILKREEYIPPKYLSYKEARKEIVQKLLKEKQDRKTTVLTQELLQKFGSLTNPDALENPETDPELIILSVPGIYELTFEEFQTLAKENGVKTIPEKKDYLSLLTLKSVCYAEAVERGWDAEDVKLTLHFWENRKLSMELALWHVKQGDIVSADNIREAYKKNQDSPRLKNPPIYELYHIFFHTPILLTMSSYERQARYLQTEQTARQALQLIKQGHPFEQVASQMAGNQERTVSSGFLGNIPMSEKLYEKIGDLKAGEVSSSPQLVNNISQNRFGYELFYVKSITSGGIMTLDETMDLIYSSAATNLYNVKKDEYFKEFTQQYTQNTDQAAVRDLIAYILFLRDHPEHQTDVVRYTQ
ncbi:hypothetical protein GF373_14675 [bacterium]|nr:hypothetical protein [bacterium]